MPDAYAYIRYSTSEQATGDSWRRQNAAIERFIAENGLELKESTAFADLGVSSFRGANQKAGLGRFLLEVDSGAIAKGSYLIVESVDRLSRQPSFDSLQLLMSLVERGINVVTLSDGGIQVLNREAGFPALVLTLASMYRAHEESHKKSLRGRESWDAKRSNAHVAPVSVRSPEWLRYSKEASTFVEIPERANVIRKIFELADKGFGRHRIVKFLNQNGLPSFRNAKNGWQASSVAKVLRSRAVIGCYQPHRLNYDDETGRKTRVPEGAEVENYYPTIVDPELFARVSARKFTELAPVRGRQGASFSNLFTGMAFCSKCGALMVLCNKGKKPKGGKYLVCSRAVRGSGCEYRSWPYEKFEGIVLSAMKELNTSAILHGVGESDLQDVRNEIACNAARAAKLTSQLQKLDAAFDEDGEAIPAGLVKKYAAIERELAGAKAKLDELKKREYSVNSRPSDPRKFSRELQTLLILMDVSAEEERYTLRRQLRKDIGLLVRRIVVWPAPKATEHRHYAVTLNLANGAERHVVLDDADELHSVDVTAEEIAAEQRQ